MYIIRGSVKPTPGKGTSIKKQNELRSKGYEDNQPKTEAKRDGQEITRPREGPYVKQKVNHTRGVAGEALPVAGEPGSLPTGRGD